MIFKVGIDASTTGTGLAIGKVDKKGNCKYYKSMVLSTEKAKYNKGKLTKAEYKKKRIENTVNRTEDMIKSIYIQLNELLKKHQIQKVIIEDVYAGNDIFTLKMLGRIQGAVYGYCYKNNIEIEFKMPLHWRKELGFPITDEDGKRIKRDDYKKIAKGYIMDKYGIDVSDDEAESICLLESDNKTNNSLS